MGILEKRLKNTEQLYESLIYLDQLSNAPLEQVLDYILEIGISVTESKSGYFYLYNERLRDLRTIPGRRILCQMEYQIAERYMSLIE